MFTSNTKSHKQRKPGRQDSIYSPPPCLLLPTHTFHDNKNSKSAHGRYFLITHSLLFHPSAIVSHSNLAGFIPPASSSSLKERGGVVGGMGREEAGGGGGNNLGNAQKGQRPKKKKE